MPKLAPLSSQKLIRILEKSGFKFVRQKGSHATFSHPDGRIVTVPIHPKPIQIGLLNKIIKFELKITRKEFENLL